MFAHQPGITGVYNGAIAKYDPSGNFIKALDIYSVPEGMIMLLYAVTDREGNIFLCCEFMVRVFLADTVINHGPGPSPYSPEIFLAKFDADFNLKWVKTISGPFQDDCWGLLISNDDHLYLTCNHYLSGIVPESVSILGQETITDTTSFSTLIKTDLNGTVEWIKVIKGAENIPSGIHLEMGQNQKIYYRGEFYYDLYVGQDTLIRPIAYNGKNDNLLITFDQDGEVENYIFHTIRLTGFAVGMNGDIFFSTIVYDTVYIGQDTLKPIGNDTAISVIGKLSPDFQSYWYHLIKKNSAGSYIVFRLLQHNDSLIFVAPVSGTIRFMDSTYVISNYYDKIFCGEFDPGGFLVGQKLLTSSTDMIPYFSILDNCKQIIISGTFLGTAVIGQDTLKSYSLLKKDNFIIKIERHSNSFDLGNDTIVCVGIELHAPPGLVLYNWNNGLSDEPELKVTQTGLYTLFAANAENCWMEDSIFVEVIPYPQVSLGNDTTIFRKDSLTLAVEGDFKSVIWSTGDTGNSILLRGNTLGTGDHLIWIEVDYGACTISDSIIITVVNNPGIETLDPELTFTIYPNPASTTINVESLLKGSIYILNLSGQQFQQELITVPKTTIDVSSLPGGVYFVKLVGEKDVKMGKFIKQ